MLGGLLGYLLSIGGMKGKFPFIHGLLLSLTVMQVWRREDGEIYYGVG